MSFPLDTQAVFTVFVIIFGLGTLFGLLIARALGRLSDLAEDEERDAWIDSWADEQEAA